MSRDFVKKHHNMIRSAVLVLNRIVLVCQRALLIFVFVFFFCCVFVFHVTYVFGVTELAHVRAPYISVCIIYSLWKECVRVCTHERFLFAYTQR